jgi:hypothetical protein
MTKPREIRFTKWLQKLAMIDCSQPVTLIHASPTRISRLSSAFLQYDTRFTGDRGFYNLDGYSEIILLMFADASGTAFTTLRPYTPDKWKYYSEQIGQQFTVVVREPVAKSPHYRQLLGLQ